MGPRTPRRTRNDAMTTILAAIAAWAGFLFLLLAVCRASARNDATAARLDEARRNADARTDDADGTDTDGTHPTA